MLVALVLAILVPVVFLVWVVWAWNPPEETTLTIQDDEAEVRLLFVASLSRRLPRLHEARLSHLKAMLCNAFSKRMPRLRMLFAVSTKSGHRREWGDASTQKGDRGFQERRCWRGKASYRPSN